MSGTSKLIPSVPLNMKLEVISGDCLEILFSPSSIQGTRQVYIHIVSNGTTKTNLGMQTVTLHLVPALAL
eukprot:15343425-Ditylum_brightwellii.AAC.1